MHGRLAPSIGLARRRDGHAQSRPLVPDAKEGLQGPDTLQDAPPEASLFASWYAAAPQSFGGGRNGGGGVTQPGVVPPCWTSRLVISTLAFIGTRLFCLRAPVATRVAGVHVLRVSVLGMWTVPGIARQASCAHVAAAAIVGPVRAGAESVARRLDPVELVVEVELRVEEIAHVAREGVRRCCSIEPPTTAAQVATAVARSIRMGAGSSM